VDVGTVLRALDWVAAGLSWLSLPLLGAALVGHARRRSADDEGRAAVSPLARLGQAVVALMVALGLTAAAAKDVPLAFGWAALAAIVLMAVLLRRDERFWAALAVLLPLFSLIGAVILAALSHNYASADTEALWYGGRQLIAWGGMEANPTREGWWWTIVALAITRYGLPLALVLTTSWLVSVRGAMSRIERLGLITAAESLFVSVLFGATFSILVLGAGLLQGLPWWLVVLGVIGSVITLVTVGPGALNGVLVGGRTLASRVPSAAQGAATLVSSLGDARGSGTAGSDGASTEPEPDATWRSVLQFVRGDLSTSKRWNLAGLAVFGGLVALGMLGTGLLQRVDDSREVRFEYISEEVGVGFRAARGVRAGDGNDVWLRGADGEVAHFDLAAGRLAATGLRVWSLAEDGDEVIGLTRSDPARVVRLDPGAPDEPEEVVTLDRAARGRLAVDGTSVFVAAADGRLTRFDRESGAQLASVRDRRPAVLVVPRGPAVWTVHEQQGDLTAPYLVVRRDPRTLEATSGPEGVDLSAVVAGDTGAGPQIELLVAGAMLGIADDDPPRFFPAADQRGAWRTEGLGELFRGRAGDGDERFDVPYDTVLGVFEAGDHTWLLVEDDQGTVVANDEVTESVLARWDAWPR
jgi:hypothetical protein